LRWLADECVPVPLIRALRANGHDVASVLEDMRSASDIDVLQRASLDRRLLLSEDRDHGELVFTGKVAKPPGVVLVRVPEDRAAIVLSRLEGAVDRFGDALHDLYIVVEESRYRARPLRPC
jgi:predicted nuclease of predicted toxin-antitoxin system